MTKLSSLLTSSDTIQRIDSEIGVSPDPSIDLEASKINEAVIELATEMKEVRDKLIPAPPDITDFINNFNTAAN